MKFLASLVGVDLDKEIRKSPDSSFVDRATKPSGTMFGDPKDYEHMSKEERQALTEKMMGAHKRVMAKTPIGRGR
jgi:hypothetical protein